MTQPVPLVSMDQRGKRDVLSILQHWLGVLQWLAPLILVLIVVAYEVGPARWLNDHLNSSYHFIAEILFYGTLGPALVFVILHLLRRWLEERETSDLQARILEQAQERAKDSHAAIDDALQALFAASVLLASLESKNPGSTPENTSALRETRLALDAKIEHLRSQLLK